jgi:PKD domain
LFSTLEVRFHDPDKVSGEDIVFLDDSLSRIELLREFIRRRCPSADDVDKDDVKPFLGKLKTSGWEGFREARLFLREVLEQIDAEELKKALDDKSAKIEINRSPRQNEPLEFTLVFRGRLKDAAAREEWSYKWNFGDGLEEFTTSPTVWHYFRLPGIRTATVRCEDLEGKVVQDNDENLPSLQVRVEPESKAYFGERAKIELVKLAIALVAAAIGLIAGARDQLIKLDAVPGLIAVFAAGFGADTIKNLIKK